MILKTDNYYLKQIFVNTGGEAPPTHRTNNWYLKGILENYTGETITTKHTSNIYLKNIYSTVSGETISEKHNNNYFLRKILESLSGEDVELNRTDNYYLSKIALLDFVPEPSNDISIELHSSNIHLSEYHNEVVYLYANVSSDGTPVTDTNVEFFIDDELIGTSLTGQYGTAVLTYTSQGRGDITVFAKVNDTTSNEILIEDCYYFNSGNKNDLLVASGTSVSTKDQIIMVTTSTSGEKKFIFPTNNSFNNSDNAMLELESARGDETGNIMGLSIHSSVNGTSNGYAGYWVDHWESKLYATTVNVPHSLEKGDIIRFVRKDGYTKLYHNDDLIASDKRYVSGFKFGGYTNKDRVQRFKNVKVKAL